MALFSRKKDKSVLPEVDQYYQGERRDRTWLAWILAAVSIALVVVVLVGLFFAGRWAYNSITDNSDSEVATSTDSGDTEPLPSFDGGPETEGEPATGTSGSSESNGETQGASTDQPDTSNSTNANESSNQGTVEAGEDAASTTTPNDVATSSYEDNDVASAETDIPNTGPGNLVATFVTVSLVAGMAHNITNRRRAARR